MESLYANMIIKNHRNKIITYQVQKRDILLGIKLGYVHFKFLDILFRDDEDIVIEALKATPYNINQVSDRLLNDREFILKIAKLGLYHFDITDYRYGDDREIVYWTIYNHGGILDYVDKRFRKDKEIVLVAMKYCGDCLECASKALRDDEDVVKVAIGNDPLALQHASKRLRNDKNIAILALQKDSRAIKYVGKDIRDDVDIIRVFNETKKKEKDLEEIARIRAHNDPQVAQLLKDFRAMALYYRFEEVDNVTREDWNLMKEKYKNGDFNKFPRR